MSYFTILVCCIIYLVNLVLNDRIFVIIKRVFFQPARAKANVVPSGFHLDLLISQRPRLWQGSFVFLQAPEDKGDDKSGNAKKGEKPNNKAKKRKNNTEDDADNEITIKKEVNGVAFCMQHV